MDEKDIDYLREQVKAEMARAEAASTAKEVAGKAIGKWGLLCITVIITIGVTASVVLEESKIAAVIGLVSAALTALIAMISGIAGAASKEEKPEFAVMKQLIDKLDKLDRQEQPMRVDVEGDRVTVRKGDDVVTTKKEA